MAQTLVESSLFFWPAESGKKPGQPCSLGMKGEIPEGPKSPSGASSSVSKLCKYPDMSSKTIARQKVRQMGIKIPSFFLIKAGSGDMG